MTTRRGTHWLFAGLAALFLSGGAGAQEPDMVLDTLKIDHPRLILLDGDVERIRGHIETNETAAHLYRELKREADGLMDEDTVEYRIVGPRLLTQSRRCLDRVYTLALMHRLDGEAKYLDRAVKELMAAAAFPDWNPSHFLDTAEMTHAFAIGYDWLFHDLTPDVRATLAEAIVEKGLMAAKRFYGEDGWWVRSTHNWNQVCNGGIGIGALAVGDEYPELSAYVLSKGLKSIPRAIHSYYPDGGWNEGPGYWHYATRYTVYFLAALQTALGRDFGLTKMEGLDNAGTFRIHFTSPTELTFNYADAGSRAGGAHEMFWLAKEYNRPVYAWHQRQRLQSPHALDLIWFTPEGDSPSESGLPLDARYHGIDVAFLRSSWDDPDAVFVGFKGGDNQANHSHLDLGSFVLDALGVRWAVDLGGDNYNLPGYFGNKRWTYYRLRTESHNTLLIDQENQDPRAKAPIVDFESKDDWAHAVADLSDAYENAERVHRGVAMIDRRHVLIQDEIEAGSPVDIEWGMLTPADISIDGHTAILEEEGKRLRVTILGPADARFEIHGANPPEPQRQNPGIQKLAVRFPEKREAARLAVLFTPLTGDGDEAPEFDVRPLGEW